MAPTRFCCLLQLPDVWRRAIPVVRARRRSEESVDSSGAAVRRARLTSQLAKVAFGGDYNPEQWSAEVRAEDLELMRRANVDLATVGVFSWAQVERRDGEFDFGFFDRVVDDLYAAGVQVCLATMTASPPPWLSARYPE